MNSDQKKVKAFLLFGLYQTLEYMGFPLDDNLIDDINQKLSMDPLYDPTDLIMKYLLDKDLAGMTIHAIMHPYYLAIEMLNQ